ncbi:MAG TPA: hypothetical protein VFW80_06980 [Gaiellaceae bacterium]|nr:hypothetical protein [Gaiellaceae bacterium]
MDLIPQVLIAGLFTPPPQVTGGPQVTIDRLNHIWAEVAPSHRYRQFQMAPDGSSAQFVGASEDEMVLIQPPLIQIRDTVELSPEASAGKAQDILKVIARHLGVSQFFNFATRLVYWAPAPESDARGFVLHRLLGKTEDDLGELVGGGSIWAGVKYVIAQDGTQYALTIEPLQRDEKMLYIDLDAQFPGELESLDAVSQRASDASTYLRQAVNRYLDKL